MHALHSCNGAVGRFPSCGDHRIAVTLSGCAVYEHRLVEPDEFARPIDRDGVAFTIEPLAYRAYEHGSRLALRISNPTDEPITLLGERSYLIDPTGETRALFGGTIAPQSHITLILPPEVETIRTGPRFGVGVGIGAGYGAGGIGVGGRHGPWGHYPSYVRESIPVWRWVTGAVRLRLAYERAADAFAHELVFERARVN